MGKLARCVLGSLVIALSGCAPNAVPAGGQAPPAAVPPPGPVSLLPSGPGAPQPTVAAVMPAQPVAVTAPAMLAVPRPMQIIAMPVAVAPCRVCSVEHIAVPVE